MGSIRRILCATDFSEIAAEAFRFAQRLATDQHAELILAHLFETPVRLSPDAQTLPADPQVAAQLAALARTATVPVVTALHAGNPGEGICWLAQQQECDLIVIGTHGRTGLVHLLLGSVSEHVMRHARCPVLTVRQRSPHEPPLPEPLVLPLKAPSLM